jgi:GWxTD domain-containing protein
MNNPANTFAYTDSIISNTPKGQPAYSTIQLLDTSYSTTQKSIFLKHGKQQIPLCANFLDNNRSTLFFYAELYNANLVIDDSLPITQTAFISKKPLEDPVFRLLYTDTIVKGALIPVNGHFDISKLHTGNYYLNIVLKNNSNEKIASTSLFIQRINTIAKNSSNTDTGGFVPMEVFDISTTFVTKYNTAQLKAILKMIKPVSTPVEVLSIDNFLKAPDESYMRYFLYNFWKERNPKDPKGAWEEYATLVKEVKRLFDGGGQPGYETERGIIYLKHGKPTEIINAENEDGAEPYQIWVYTTMARQSNGGMFLFYRPGFMMGDYRLLHSNVKGETRNLDWRSILYKTGKQTSMSNSRAEQYFPGSK